MGHSVRYFAFAVFLSVPAARGGVFARTAALCRDVAALVRGRTPTPLAARAERRFGRRLTTEEHVGLSELQSEVQWSDEIWELWLSNIILGTTELRQRLIDEHHFHVTKRLAQNDPNRFPDDFSLGHRLEEWRALRTVGWTLRFVSTPPFAERVDVSPDTLELLVPSVLGGFSSEMLLGEAIAIADQIRRVRAFEDEGSRLPALVESYRIPGIPGSPLYFFATRDARFALRSSGIYRGTTTYSQRFEAASSDAAYVLNYPPTTENRFGIVQIDDLTDRLWFVPNPGVAWHTYPDPVPPPSDLTPTAIRARIPGFLWRTPVESERFEAFVSAEAERLTARTRGRLRNFIADAALTRNIRATQIALATQPADTEWTAASFDRMLAAAVQIIVHSTGQPPHVAIQNQIAAIANALPTDAEIELLQAIGDALSGDRYWQFLSEISRMRAAGHWVMVPRNWEAFRANFERLRRMHYHAPQVALLKLFIKYYMNTFKLSGDLISAEELRRYLNTNPTRTDTTGPLIWQIIGTALDSGFGPDWHTYNDYLHHFRQYALAKAAIQERANLAQ